MSRWAGDGITYPFPNLGITCDHAVTHFVLYWYGIYKLEIQVLVLSDYLGFFSTFDKGHISLLGFVAKRWIMKYVRLLPDLIAWICFTCSDTTCMPWIASLKGHDKGQEWGLLKLRSSVFLQAKFSVWQKYLLHSLNLIHIWLVSPQLTGGDTYQIWTWYSMANMYFGDVEKLGEYWNAGIGLVTPTPDRISISQPKEKHDFYSSHHENTEDIMLRISNIDNHNTEISLTF